MKKLKLAVYFKISQTPLKINKNVEILNYSMSHIILPQRYKSWFRMNV